jgi:hypothetical protein
MEFGDSWMNAKSSVERKCAENENAEIPCHGYLATY